MDGSVSCDTRAYTTCANKPVCLSMAQIYGLHMHHRCILCLRRGGSRSRKGCPPAHRWGFHPGLIRARAGGDRWPAERSRDCRRPRPFTPHQSLPPTPPSLTLWTFWLSCAWLSDIKEEIFGKISIFFLRSSCSCTSHSTSPSLVWGCHMEVTADPPVARCPALRTP